MGGATGTLNSTANREVEAGFLIDWKSLEGK